MLQRALEKARQESATWLLDKADEQGFTALHYAIMKDADSCVEVLLHHGADVECQYDSAPDLP